MTHTISEKDLNEWLCRPQWQLYASSAERSSHKRLEIDSADGVHMFRTTHNGETIFLGSDKTAAIAAYNMAR